MTNAKNNRKPSPRMGAGSILMRVAAVLLCMVLGSFYLMGGMFARYATTGTGSDSARVAKFDVKVTGSEDVTVDCAESSEGTYKITISNESEVAVTYDIDVTYNAVVGVTHKLEQEFGTLAVGATNAENPGVLTFTVDWDTITENMTNEMNSVSLAFTVTIDVVQID